jgi:Subtilisin inhibitor-like
VGSGGGGEAVPGTDLAITVWPRGRQCGARTATLTCDPSGGTHPSPAEACKTLAASSDALAPVPADAICAMVFGGPQEAMIAGTLDGANVRAGFSHRNGCEIDRWEKLAAVLRVGD